MNQIRIAQERLEQAGDLPAILDAACSAFEDMLPLIQAQQDRLGSTFAAFMLAGASAASGRFAVLAAPSLPRAAAVGPAAGDPCPGVSAETTGVVLAGLSQLLASRLDDAGASAVDAADRAACADAARHARVLCAWLGGAPPR